MIPVLLAAPDLTFEPELVSRAGAAGVKVLRRCVDAVDLFGAAALDPGPAVVVSAGLPRLRPDTLERVGLHRVVGLADSDDAAALLREFGVERTVRAAVTSDATLIELRALLSAEQARQPEVWSTGVWSAEADSGEAGDDGDHPREGVVLVVWGPAGAPGRTTVALGVAEALADSGRRVALVDADTYAPAVTLALGLQDHASGLAVCCRHADNGTLTGASVHAAGHRMRRGWTVIGGIGRPDRWADLRPAALDRVWATCRTAFDVTVIDVGFCLERDDAGAWAARRNAATLSALGAADQVLAVADSSALGAARLVSAWPALTNLVTPSAVIVVQNRARRGDRGWVEGLSDLGVHAPVRPVPWDPKAVTSCWATARSLREGARRSSLRRALGALGQAAVSR